MLHAASVEVGLRLSRARRAAALTGAGISAESGIPTFRSGATALWRNYRAEELATPEAFARDPSLVTEWYLMRLQMVRDARPNAGHLALAQIERFLAARGAGFSLLTQNVDGLHGEGGSQNVVELHGNIRTWRCVACGKEQLLDKLCGTNLLRDCGGADFVEDRCGADLYGRPTNERLLPLHCSCGSMLRPGVVWFGETLPPNTWERAERAASEADVFIVAGTSAAVYPAAGLVAIAKHAGAFVVEINPEATGATRLCDIAVRSPSGEFLPLVCDRLL
jgi:NAD-dependent SIR2 family protein deacetylase